MPEPFAATNLVRSCFATPQPTPTRRKSVTFAANMTPNGVYTSINIRYVWHSRLKTMHFDNLINLCAHLYMIQIVAVLLTGLTNICKFYMSIHF